MPRSTHTAERAGHFATRTPSVAPCENLLTAMPVGCLSGCSPISLESTIQESFAYGNVFDPNASDVPLSADIRDRCHQTINLGFGGIETRRNAHCWWVEGVA